MLTNQKPVYYLNVFLIFYASTYVILYTTIGLAISNSFRSLLIVTFGSIVLLLFNRILTRTLSLSNESLIVLVWAGWVITNAVVIFGQEYEGIFDPIFRRIFLVTILFIHFNSNKSIQNYKMLFIGLGWGAIIIIFLSIIFGLPLYTTGYRIGEFLMYNANNYSYMIFLLLIGVSYHVLSKSGYKRTFWVFIFLSLLTFIVLSGSRKSFIAFIIFISGMAIFRSSKGLMLQPSKVIQLLLFFGLIVLMVDFVLSNTVVGERLLEAFMQEKHNRYLDERLTGRGKYFTQGWDLFMNNMIFGVGINNFNHYELSGQVSHSEYVSMLAEGGIVAFVLYFSVYGITISKLVKVLKNPLNKEVLLVAQIFFLAIICILILDFGRWNYDHPLTFIVVAFANQFANTNRAITQQIFRKK